MFAIAERVPRERLSQIRAIAGVAAAHARVESTALIDIEGMVEPATARIMSLPPKRALMPNALVIGEGRLPNPGQSDETAASTAFADAQDLRLGDELAVLLNGRKRTLTITAIAHSPEFIYAIGSGNPVPDNRRFGVLWIPQEAAEAAFDLKGAFNSLAVRVMRGASTSHVIERIDTELKRYGGSGAFARKDHVSHAFIDAELLQIEAMARVMPPIFLAVAAFLINMTLARMVRLSVSRSAF